MYGFVSRFRISRGLHASYGIPGLDWPEHGLELLDSFILQCFNWKEAERKKKIYVEHLEFERKKSTFYNYYVYNILTATSIL